MIVLGCLLIIVGLVIGYNIADSIDIINNTIESHPNVVDKDSMRNQVIGTLIFITLLIIIGGIALII